MKLRVCLGDTSDSFDIQLFDNHFVTKWTKELQWCLDNCAFNQQEAFASLLTLDESASILQKSCETINRYLSGMIEIREDLLSQPQEYYNYLHLIFEKVNGSFDRPTRLLTVAPKELKSAVRNLNFFVHRLETRSPPQDGLYISFDKDQYRRHRLDIEDYDRFEFSLLPGTLFLHYAELGKTFLDLFEDHLPINYDNFRNLHYYSGEAWLTLDKLDLENKPGFFQWITSQGFDPYDKTLGHGHIPLGIVNDIDLARQLLHNRRQLTKILIED